MEGKKTCLVTSRSKVVIQFKQTKPKYDTKCGSPKQKSLTGHKDENLIAQSKSGKTCSILFVEHQHQC